MSVVVLIYHKTPAAPDGDSFSVPLEAFKAQIEAIRAAGHQFVRFEETLESVAAPGPARVCVTFDDAHASNIEALEFLRQHSIVPMVFVVRRWSESDPEFLSAKQIAALAPYVDFGGHGVTHRAMTHLNDTELAGEMADSRAYLEGVLGRRIRAMAFPGGRFNARTVQAAHVAGYTHIGTSVSLDNRRRGRTINRVTVHAGRSAESLAGIIGANRSYWTLQRARRVVTAMASMVLPSPLFTAVAKARRGLWPAPT